MRYLLSPIKLHLPKIALRPDFNPRFLHLINVLKNKNNNSYISRENNTWNKTSLHQYTLKVKCLLSLLKLNILKITMRPNYRPSMINLIKILNNQKNNWWISWNNSTKNRNILKITGSYQLRNTAPLRIYWSSQWNTSQFLTTITFTGESYL